MGQSKRGEFKVLNKNSTYLMQMCEVTIDGAVKTEVLIPLKEFKSGEDSTNHVQDVVKWVRNNPEELLDIAYRKNKGAVRNLYIVRVGWEGGAKQQTTMKID